jgi:hypothetical protein
LLSHEYSHRQLRWVRHPIFMPPMRIDTESLWFFWPP